MSNKIIKLIQNYLPAMQMKYYVSPIKGIDYWYETLLEGVHKDLYAFSKDELKSLDSYLKTNSSISECEAMFKHVVGLVVEKFYC